MIDPKPSMREALERASCALQGGILASCTCMTKSPEPGFHAAGCRYREIRCAIDDIDAALGAQSGVPVTLVYTNYRGETAPRTIIPRSTRFAATEWHPEPQWLLLAFDVEKNSDREFAIKDFGSLPSESDS